MTISVFRKGLDTNLKIDLKRWPCFCHKPTHTQKKEWKSHNLPAWCASATLIRTPNLLIRRFSRLQLCQNGVGCGGGQGCASVEPKAASLAAFGFVTAQRRLFAGLDVPAQSCVSVEPTAATPLLFFPGCQAPEDFYALMLVSSAVPMPARPQGGQRVETYRNDRLCCYIKVPNTPFLPPSIAPT